MSKRRECVSDGQVSSLVRSLFMPALIKMSPHFWVIVGVLQRAHQLIFTLGSNDCGQVDGNTRIPVGSITKPVTAMLLAEMIQRGELSLGDSIVDLLPDSQCWPRQTRQITLFYLAAHYGGLPYNPRAIRQGDPSNPYAHYCTQDLYAYISTQRLKQSPGRNYWYSNLGYGLLGNLLAFQLGTSYSEAVAIRILEPLGMAATSTTIDPAACQLLRQGYDKRGSPVNNWQISPDIAGCGGLYSTAENLLKLLQANMATDTNPLTAALRRTQGFTLPTNKPNLSVSLGWHVKRVGTPARKMFFHHGGGRGFSSFAGFVPTKQLGVVVLSNSHYSTKLTKLRTGVTNAARRSLAAMFKTQAGGRLPTCVLNNFLLCPRSTMFYSNYKTATGAVFQSPLTAEANRKTGNLNSV